MSERGDLLTRMKWPMCQTVVQHVLLMKAVRSTLKMKYFVRERKDPLLIMTWVMSERGGHRLQISRTTTFRCEVRAEYQRSRIDSEKLRTIQIDMLFNKIYDRINHLIHSVQNQKQIIQDGE